MECVLNIDFACNRVGAHDINSRGQGDCCGSAAIYLRAAEIVNVDLLGAADSYAAVETLDCYRFRHGSFINSEARVAFNFEELLPTVG